jgi:class 3 adenylate cyclase/tetratricopeptide (TPR) repeat protein
MTEQTSELVTILFTDLVGSTELLSRAGDEEAQRIFRAHHNLLAEAAAAHGGEEVKWLGDGLMVAFASAAGALRAAIAMQHACRRPVHGEQLAIRVGLNVGEALRETTDYFGLPVVVARRLCDRAQAGQILCTEVVASLLGSRAEFAFCDLGKLELKGVTQAVAAFELRSEAAPFRGIPSRMPFVGREAERRRLEQRLTEAIAGRGGAVMVAGEPGIGKTRLAEELAEQAQRAGTKVLWGHCFEGEWTPPYAPFTDAVEALAIASDPEELEADLRAGGPPLAQLVPALRKVLPGLPEPVPLQPDEERFRLLDAVAQLLLAHSERVPLLLVLEDLHWADRGTVAMLRHLARFVPAHRILLIGTYRDAEIDRSHPLADALGALPRETGYDQLRLGGLPVEAVGELLVAVAEQDLNQAVVADFADETGGNPFFLQEALRHLIEEGKIYRGPDGLWTSDRRIRDLGIPEGVRAVIARRLARLPEPARRLLGVAAVFEGAFRFDVVAGVAELSEADALDAFDEAVAAQLVRPAGDADTCAFTHALVRDALYAELSPPRRARLHRRVAEALEVSYGREPSPIEAGEIASQYHRSAGLPGAERGVDPALQAAAHADATGAHDEAAAFLRMALALLATSDPRRPHLLGRLGIALAWARAFDEAVRVAEEAGAALAESEGVDPAAEYLSEATYTCGMAGGAPHAWTLARQGLDYAGARRDVAWARMVFFDLQRQEAEDPEYPGIPLDTPERHEAAQILRAAHKDPMGLAPLEAVFSTGAEARASRNLAILLCMAGEFGRCLDLLEGEAEQALVRGQPVRAARCRSFAAFCLVALGRLLEAGSSIEEAQALFKRAGGPIFIALHAREQLVLAVDGGWEEVEAAFDPLATGPVVPTNAWALGSIYAIVARMEARQGRGERALHYLELLVPWLERAPAWTIHFPMMACYAADVLWLLQRLDHAEVIERALQEKVVAPDFRDSMVDGRLAMARLSALQGRHEEALHWFGEARRVLDEQGARPLLAIADYDEALMYSRRASPGDADRARTLLSAARQQFEAIGMTGWTRRSEELISG